MISCAGDIGLAQDVHACLLSEAGIPKDRLLVDGDEIAITIALDPSKEL